MNNIKTKIAKEKWEKEFDDFAEQLEDEYFVLPEMKEWIAKLIKDAKAQKIIDSLKDG